MTRSPGPAGPYMAYPGDDAWPPDMSAWSHGRQAADARFESPGWPAEIAWRPVAVARMVGPPAAHGTPAHYYAGKDELCQTLITSPLGGSS
jgi:hypothetical protein